MNPKMRLLKNKLVFFVTMICMLAGIATTVHAEQPKGITISPAVLYFTVSSNLQSQSKTVTITNNEEATVQLTVQIKNVDESTGILAPTNELTDAQSKVMRVSTPKITLAKGASIDVTITASTGEELKPGGSYFALVVTQQANGTNAVGLNPSVGAGIFVTNENGANRHITLVSSSVGRILFGIPKIIKTQFTNDGNVVVVPRGIIVIGSNKGDAYIAKGVINTASQPIFPKKNITIDTPMESLMHPLWPAKVHVVYQYRFDGTDLTTTVAKNVIMIPPLFILEVLVIAIITTLTAQKVRGLRKSKGSEKRVVQEEQPQSNTKPKRADSKKIAVKDATDGDKITVRTE